MSWIKILESTHVLQYQDKGFKGNKMMPTCAACGFFSKMMQTCR